MKKIIPIHNAHSELQMAFDAPYGNFDIEDEPGMVHVVAVSGGADSAALALVLHARYPQIRFRMVMTDTGAESDNAMAFLKEIERFTGNTIEIIRGEHTLFGLIEKYNGYLPSAQARWCTRELKLVVFQKWLSQFEGQLMTMYVGIRADEAKRVAFDIPGVETVLPFVEMGWKREHVFGYLAQTIGVPKTYLTRTRSGCTVCPFVQRQESVLMYQHSPKDFEIGMKYEKLSDVDKDRHPPGPPLWADTGLGLNWLSFPIPIGQEMAANRSHKPDLFGTRGLFVACEFFFDVMPGMEPFIWHQQLISYSPTLAGMKKQVNSRFSHLLNTAEVQDMTQQDVRDNAKFAIYYVELPSDVFDVDGPNGGYTWQQGQSYAQVRHITDWLTRALQASQLKVEAERKVRNNLSVQYEWKQSASHALGKAAASPNPVGGVVDSMWYQPQEVAHGKDVDPDDVSPEQLIPCPMCTI